MSNNLIINQKTNSKNDNCFNNFQNLNNKKLFEYNFIPSIKSNINNIDIVGLLPSNNYDKNGNNIENSTLLRNGQKQNLDSKRELDTRLFIGSPLMSIGQSELKNTDLSSRLKFGEETRTTKSNNSISSYSADNFIPLVPSLAGNIQNVDHIIPTFWVRGGMSSRAVVRNIDYMKSCGLNK